jgi:type IV pilus assembly protein PilY1
MQRVPNEKEEGEMKRLLFVLVLFLLSLAGPLYGDDTSLFTVGVSPNVLVILDNSGSMNLVIYHSNYNRSTTYSGIWDSSYEQYFLYNWTYTTASYTNPYNGRTASLYYGPGDDGNGVRYSGNYLNWIFYYASASDRTTLPQQTRIQLAKQVVMSMFNSITGVNFGLMAFNYDNGGSVTAPCGSDLAHLTSGLNAILADNWTPLSETMVEAWLYFKGATSYYNTGVTYTSPIRQYCQKNFIILVTDGEPTYDYTFPSWVLPAIAGHYDTTPQSDNNGRPYYLDGVAWYLNNNDARSDLSGMQNVTIYTIGYFKDSPLLQKTASNGDGLYFTAYDISGLTTALQASLNDIIQRSYSFTSPTIASVRLVDGNVAYLASFTPNATPFWPGDLKAYTLNADGTLPLDANGNPLSANLIWGAANVFRGVSPSSRTIYTYINGPGLDAFTTTNPNLTNAVLGLSSNQDRLDLINHMRGVDAYDVNRNGNKTETRDWFLGDIFHSNAVIVGSPSSTFVDTGFSGPGGFYQNNKNRTKVIIVGANDGMLHAFDAATGDEKWAFIPKSLLTSLKSMKSAHTYYVDGTPKVADVWFDYDGTNTKAANEWRTVLVCGLKQGGKSYFALDVTDTLNPKYLWEFPNPSDPNYSTILSRLGQSWSDPALGRVKVNGYEKWVAFIGGGFNASDNVGCALYVVDLRTGIPIKEFYKVIDKMNHPMPAPPTAVDTNGDGYINKVYIGDLHGQMWVFDVSDNNPANWKATMLFQASDSPQRQFYYQPAVAFDKSRNLWVYFGTADDSNPTDISGPTQRLYAIKDDGLGNYPRKEGDLKDVTSNPSSFDPVSGKGWFIGLAKTDKSLESVLAKAVVFNNLVYFSTYTAIKDTSSCDSSTIGKLYVVEYLSGGGALSTLGDHLLPPTPSAPSTVISSGVPSAPVISIDLKAKATVSVMSTSGQALSQKAHSPTVNKSILYWREVVP